ncbi:MAG: hypothetical protein ACPG6P_12610 [Akkermansiaceae bacterium]
MIEIPIEWILGTIGLLGTTISTLATIIFVSLNSRLKTQDAIIKRLQDDIDRISKGCGIKECLWKDR